MHVLQWIAVKDVEDKDEAFRSVRNTLESYLEGEYNGAWYDWFVTGGGRWNVQEGEDYTEAYKDKSNMVLSFEEDPFLAKIDECIELRVAEFNDYRKSFDNASVDLSAKLDSYDGTTEYSFDLYPLNKMIEMLQGEWDFNSYFYDLEHYSTNPKFMLDSIASGDVNWYLVPVDFHF